VSVRLEDYALLSDTYSAALVSRDGSVDWLAFPRFDSAPFFAALLGTEKHGCWRLAPVATDGRSTRSYRDGSLVLETEHHTPDGDVVVTDCLGVDEDHRFLRLVEGKRGRVHMRSEMRFRFDYGSIVPWVRTTPDGLEVIAGPEALRIRTSVDLRGEDFSTIGEFAVAEGDTVAFELTWHPSHENPPKAVKVQKEIEKTVHWWSDWRDGCTYDGEYAQQVRDSLVVVKGLSFSPTGAIVAAPTTSLPERLGGERNWDYRYCWVRDATFSLLALLESGYVDEARQWRDWLLRALAGDPDHFQILYGLAGERRLTELEIDWLPGYEESRPVRTGNAAHKQFQLDVYGELMDALFHAGEHGVEENNSEIGIQCVMLDSLAEKWRDPDEGIWEVRGKRRHFTHSKVMAWVAFDRAVRAFEDGHFADEEGPSDDDAKRWRALRDEIHAEVCERGVDDRGVFTQSYGSSALDASVLMIPIVGFLPPSDRRVVATVEAIERELVEDGLVHRYQPEQELDGLQGEEGAFLLCSFWLADNYALLGRTDDARELFERLLDLRNDVGLLSEEVEPSSRRLLGNFPQAFSHVSLVNTAQTLCGAHRGAAQKRSER
jgi:GH15 family glucan-1,4-alpha-glucosidase